MFLIYYQIILLGMLVMALLAIILGIVILIHCISMVVELLFTNQLFLLKILKIFIIQNRIGVN